MTARLTFLGASQNITGSSYLLKNNNLKILVDCGLYQEREYLNRNWEPFAVEPRSLDAVLLTHAHLDHCGRLPRLVKDGFKNPVYCTAPTADIAEISLLDSGRIQEEDAAFKKQRHEREGRKGPHPEIPLYTVEDARKAAALFSPVDYGDKVKLNGNLSAVFYDAGHVLGSAMIKVSLDSKDTKKTIVFSGDIGRPRSPMLDEPTVFDEADYVVMEATYGGMTHETREQASRRLAQIIRDTAEGGGNIVIPSFALERAQDVLYYINRFILANEIPNLPVFLDSPMAVNITGIFSRYPELLDADMRDMLATGQSPFEFPELTLVSNAEESRAIAEVKGPAIIIAGSGMATGGRIKHHLVNNISRPENSIVFVGYQAEDTLGRQITEGADEVRINGQSRPVRARIEKLDGFSAHADSNDLLKWLADFKKPPEKLFITHAEPEAAQQFARSVEQRYRWKPIIPAYGDEYEL